MIRTIAILLLSFTLYASDIKIGYSVESMSDINKRDLKISMVLWIEEIISQTEYTADYIDYDETQSMAKDFNTGKLDLVIDFGINFVKYYELDKLSDGFRGGMKNNHHENIIIVLQESSSLEKFSKLRNPVIALQRIEEIFKIYGIVHLMNKKKNFIFLETKKRSGALLKLFFNNADAALVTEKTFDFVKELNPQVGKKLKIVRVSDVKAGAYGYFHKNFDPIKREAMIKIALGLDKSVRGKQLLSLFKIDVVKKSKVSELANIKKLYEAYIKIKKGKK